MYRRFDNPNPAFGERQSESWRGK